MAIILIGATAAVTFSIAQSNDEQMEEYAGTDREYLFFEQIDHITHDIELPESMTFCGEEVPLDLFYVRERLERELMVNTYRHSATILLLKRTTRWFPVMEPIMEKNGLPEDFKYLSMIESELTNAVSPSKAVGFWQFLEGTGKEYGLEINKEVDMRYNVEKETVAAVQVPQRLLPQIRQLDLGGSGLQLRQRAHHQDAGGTTRGFILRHDTARGDATLRVPHPRAETHH